MTDAETRTNPHGDFVEALAAGLGPLLLPRDLDRLMALARRAEEADGLRGTLAWVDQVLRHLADRAVAGECRATRHSVEAVLRVTALALRREP